MSPDASYFPSARLPYTAHPTYRLDPTLIIGKTLSGQCSSSSVLCGSQCSVPCLVSHRKCRNARCVCSKHNNSLQIRERSAYENREHQTLHTVPLSAQGTRWVCLAGCRSVCEVLGQVLISGTKWQCVGFKMVHEVYQMPFRLADTAILHHVFTVTLCIFRFSMGNM